MCAYINSNDGNFVECAVGEVLLYAFYVHTNPDMN